MVCVCGHYGVASHGEELGSCRGTSRIVKGKREFYPCEKNCQQFRKENESNE